jgi:hypothetical protein
VQNTELYPEELRRAGNDLGRIAQDLGTRFNNLISAVNGLASPWGGDDIGMLIGESYNAVQEIAQESFASVMESLEDFGVGLIDFAEAATRAEQDITSDFDGIGRQLDGNANP